MHLSAISLASCTLLSLCLTTPAGAQPRTARYNQVYRKACHNCFEKQYAGSMAEVLDHVASIEIDFYDSRVMFLGTGGRRGDWYVRHGGTGTNDNCCGPGGNSNLSTCLENLAGWSDAHPGHPVVTVFLDKKQAWGDAGEGRHPADLDHLVLAKIPRAKLFTPADLKGAFPTLRAAARANAWPTLAELPGKFVFVLTGGQLGHANRTQHQYVVQRGDEAVVFVAPNTDAPEDVLRAPGQFSDATAGWVVFYNLKARDQAVAPLIYGQGYISRVYNAPETDPCYRQLATGRMVHFIALYDFRQTRFNGGRMTGAFIPGK